MNWSSENLMRGRVLRDWDVDLAATPRHAGRPRHGVGALGARHRREPRARSSRRAKRATRPGSKRATRPGTRTASTTRAATSSCSASSCSSSAARPTRSRRARRPRAPTSKTRSSRSRCRSPKCSSVTSSRSPTGAVATRSRGALALAPVHGDVVARLHPADIAVLGDPATLSPGRVLAIVPDPSLSPGDCVVDVASCRVDARISAAIERAREVLS